MMNSMGLLIAILYLKVFDCHQILSSSFDSNQFKMAQREGWDSGAQGWKEWWEYIEKADALWSNHIWHIVHCCSILCIYCASMKMG
jgi:hypothetical protein